MKSLILGGVKSGKSLFAETCASDSGKPVVLIATASALDSEMAARIQSHKKRRPVHWQTIEEPISLGATLCSLEGPSGNGDSTQSCIIIDCLTLWLTNLLLLEDQVVFEAEKNYFIRALDKSSHQILIVSNETNMGIVPMTELSRRFCDEAGRLHQHLGKQVDNVVLMVAGINHTIKGKIG
ncbi:MAG: bifunctional adenosylcobinamide kinase/adenosylcobinamide-phosphate guanylyltransferase [Granulosicoccus sp.]